MGDAIAAELTVAPLPGAQVEARAQLGCLAHELVERRVELPPACALNNLACRVHVDPRNLDVEIKERIHRVDRLRCLPAQTSDDGARRLELLGCHRHRLL